MKQETAAIEVDGLSARYDNNIVLQDICWSVPEGQLAAVIGPNGGGKSTLVKTLVGMIREIEGHVQLFGQRPRRMRSAVAYLPQSEEVDWSFPITVLDVVLQGRLAHYPWWKKYSPIDRQRALEKLEQFGMAGFAARPVGELSGGQRQRVFLARALMQQARLIIMDEPAAGLDAAAQHSLLELFEELKQAGHTVVITTHDLNCLAQHFDSVLGLNRRIVFHGVPESVLNTAALTELFAIHFPIVNPSGEVVSHDSRFSS